MNGWMVKRVNSGVRATVLSARDMCDSGGQVVAGPVFGLIGTIASIRVALLVGAAMLGPAIGLLTSASLRTKTPSSAPSTPLDAASEDEK